MHKQKRKKNPIYKDFSPRPTSPTFEEAALTRTEYEHLYYLSVPTEPEIPFHQLYPFPPGGTLIDPPASALERDRGA